VYAAILTKAIGKEHERGKNEHAAEGHHVKRGRVHGKARWHKVARECIGGRQNAEDDHQASPGEASEAEFAVNVHSVRRDQRGLHDEKDQLAAENCAMHVNQFVGQRGVKDTGKIVSASEAQDDCGEQQCNHERYEAIVVTATWIGSRCNWWSDSGNHGSSVLERNSRNDL
jgi:hypothetical protein